MHQLWDRLLFKIKMLPSPRSQGVPCLRGNTTARGHEVAAALLLWRLRAPARAAPPVPRGAGRCRLFILQPPCPHSPTQPHTTLQHPGMAALPWDNPLLATLLGCPSGWGQMCQPQSPSQSHGSTHSTCTSGHY